MNGVLRKSVLPRPFSASLYSSVGRECAVSKRFYVKIANDGTQMDTLQHPWLDNHPKALGTFVVQDSDLHRQIEKLISVEEVFEFFSVEKERLRPAELSSLILRLHDLILLRKSSKIKKWNHQKKRYFNNKNFLMILSRLLKILDAFTPRELTRIVFALHSLEFPDNSFYKTLEPFLVSNLPNLRSNNFVQLYEILISANALSKISAEAFLRAVSPISPTFSLSSLSSWCETAAKSSHLQVASLRAVENQVQQKLTQLKPKQLSMVAFAYSSWPSACDHSLIAISLERFFDECELLVEKHQKTNGDKSLTEDSIRKNIAPSISIVRSLFAAAKTLAPEITNRYFNQSLPLLRVLVNDMSSQELAMVLWAVRKCDFDDVDFYNDVRLRTEKKILRMSAKPLAMTVRSLAETVSRVILDEETLTIDNSILRRAERKVIRQIKNFDARSIASVIYAYYLARVGSQSLWSNILSAVSREHQNFTPDEIVRVFVAFANLRTGHQIYNILQNDIRERISQFSQHNLCDLLFGMALMRVFDAKLVRDILMCLNVETVRNDERCLLFLPAMCELFDSSKNTASLSFENKKILMEFHKKNFFEHQKTREFCESVANDIHQILKETILPQEEVLVAQELDGYLLDVSIPSLQLCINILSPLNCHLLTSRLPSKTPLDGQKKVEEINAWGQEVDEETEEQGGIGEEKGSEREEERGEYSKTWVPSGICRLRHEFLTRKQDMRVVYVSFEAWRALETRQDKVQFLSRELLSCLETAKPNQKIKASTHQFIDTSLIDDFKEIFDKFMQSAQAEVTVVSPSNNRIDVLETAIVRDEPIHEKAGGESFATTNGDLLAEGEEEINESETQKLEKAIGRRRRRLRGNKEFAEKINEYGDSILQRLQSPSVELCYTVSVNPTYNNLMSYLKNNGANQKNLPSIFSANYAIEKTSKIPKEEKLKSLYNSIQESDFDIFEVLKKSSS